MAIFRKSISVNELIEYVRKNRDLDEGYCVYGHGDSSKMTLETECYLDGYADDDDEEVYPKFVTDNKLDFWFMDELIEGVIENALYQKIKVTNSEIMMAIIFYNEKDTFMDF